MTVPLYEWAAYYDPVTDEIRNCTPQSRTWFHEDRHRQQHKRFSKRFAKGLEIISGMAVMLAPWMMILGELRGLLYCVAALLPIGLTLVFSEIDAEVYAWRAYFRGECVR